MQPSWSSLGLLASSLVSVVSGASYSNPLRPSAGGDPVIVWQDGFYYQMSTNFVDLRMVRATTLDGLKNGEERLVYDPTRDDPSRCCNVWAPELHKVDGSWYVHYSAGTSGAPDNQRPQVLKGGSNPWDAFNFAGTVNSPAWGIDATLLTIANKDYYVYSAFRNDTGTSLQSLVIAEHVSPSVIGEEYLLSSPTAPWETVGMPVNEGPFALYSQGKTYLTFSASYCHTTSYTLGLLTYVGGDPLDQASWSKSNGPVFSNANGQIGVGHNSFFTSPAGDETWITYHSATVSGGSCGNERSINSQAISFGADGTPNFGAPVTQGQSFPGPSGE